MADKKISQLSPASTPLAGTEVLPIVQGGATVKVSAADVTSGRAVSALTYTSTATTGTAPFTVSSTTEVANLRAATATAADSATSANAVKSNATTGLLQVTGPGAGTTRVVTVPDANFTAARTDAGQTFTGVNTFTSPKVITSIDDTNGNELFKVTATASAVNEFTVANAAASGSPTLSATGNDTNIAITLTPKGTGRVVAAGVSIKQPETNSVAIGDATLSSASLTGDQNTAVGYLAAQNVTTGKQNVVVGNAAFRNATTGRSNVAVGALALQSSVTGNCNVAVGSYQDGSIEGPLHAVSSGSDNVGIGTAAGWQLTTGSANILIGRRAGETATTGNYNICLGVQANTSAAGATDQIVIGTAVTGQADANVTIGNGSGKIYNAYTVNATWTQTSDGRLKADVKDDSLGLSFINRLRPVTYKWKPSNELDKDNPYYAEENNRKTDVVMHGLIAQEVKAALDAEGVTTFAGWDQGPDGIQAISREMFISPLIKAIQELSARVAALESK